MAAAPEKASPPAEARESGAACRHRSRPPASGSAEGRSAQGRRHLPAEPAKPAPAASSSAAGKRRQGQRAASVEAQRDSDGLRVTFCVAAPTPAALFRRADTVWMVFDTLRSMSTDPRQGRRHISDVSRLPLEKGQAIRIRLNRPQMPSLESDDRSSGTTGR